jgi:hypothetical protein
MAQNNSSTDYIRLAYLQCLSLKITNPELPYALVTDQASASTMTQAQKSSFDQVITLPVDWAKDQEWKQRNDWQLFALSPFTETIKVESDLLFTQNISHWWRMLEHRDVVLSLGCRDYRGYCSTNRTYRKIFDANNLPDTYSGLMYWRKSPTAATFFSKCKQLYQQWETVQKELVQCDDLGSNDMVFALAAVLVGVDKVTLPAADFFNFVHMKQAIQTRGIGDLNVELVPPTIRINGHEQLYPVHYHNKEWVTDEMINDYANTI